MDTKKLRQKILDLAIRGKLVPQDPNDEPASVLLERIKKEKERLTKEGKIKRDKKEKTSDTSHYRKLPFEVPKGWVYCRLSNIASFGGGKTPSTANNEFWDKGDHLWVTSKDMKSSIIEDSLMKISDMGTVGMQIFPPLTILMVVRSGILRRTLPIAILKKDATINQDLKAICLYNNSIADFVFWVLKACEQSILDIYQKDGTTVESINFEKFQDIEIPLPPLAEQRRIVSVIESAFAIIDEIDDNKQDLTQIIKQAKSKVLDLAIRGKLVPQDLNDESASVLLERIRKSQKTVKPTSDISHYPFELPQGWVWCSLGELCDYGTCINVSSIEIPSDAWVLDLEDIEKETAILLQRIRKIDRNTTSVRHSFSKGDVLYSKLRTYLNKVLVADTNGFCSTEILPLNFKGLVVPEYARHVLMSKMFLDYTAQCGYGVKMPRLGTTDGKKALFPLPPLAEQKRIVQEIEVIFQTLDIISNNL